MEMQVLEKLGILNLHSVFGRGVRGETLSRGCYMGEALERIRDAGVKVVVDFRTSDHNDRFGRRCADVGIVYHHIPIDAQVTPPEKMFEDLPRLFEVLDGDGFYISCQQGLHRTDIALALYYFFHNDREVPDMFGHYRNGDLRCYDIMRRVNMMRPFFPEVDETLFLQRRKRFLAFNREKSIAYKNGVEGTAGDGDSTCGGTTPAAMKRAARAFGGEFYFLNNFYPASVEVDGISYQNAEAAFQAQKCADAADRVAFAELPAVKAKRKGRQVRLRPDWDAMRLSVMEEVVRAKFTQNPDLVARLVATGAMPLVEGNFFGDTFWGVDAKTGKGENNLGKILMKIREALCNVSH